MRGSHGGFLSRLTSLGPVFRTGGHTQLHDKACQHRQIHYSPGFARVTTTSGLMSAPCLRPGLGAGRAPRLCLDPLGPGGRRLDFGAGARVPV